MYCLIVSNFFCICAAIFGIINDDGHVVVKRTQHRQCKHVYAKEFSTVTFDFKTIIYSFFLLLLVQVTSGT